MNDRAPQIFRILFVRCEASIGLFTRADARGRRANDNGNAICAITLARRRNRICKAIAVQSTPRKSIIAAVPSSKLRRQWLLFQSRNTTDPRDERRRPKIIRRQPTSPLPQRRQRPLAAIPRRGAKRVSGDTKGGQWSAGIEGDRGSAIADRQKIMRRVRELDRR